MECKITRQSVTFCEKSYCQTVEQPIDAEFTMPDYCPSINKILKCRLRPMVSGKSMNGNTCIVEGVTAIVVYYVGEGGRICSYEHSVPFSKSTEVDAADSVVTVDAQSDYVNCKASGERRLDVHATVKLKFCVKSMRTADIVTDIDQPSVQQNRIGMPATSCLSMGEKYVIIVDEFDLPEDMPPIASLLRHDERVVVDESKLVSNKAVIKGNVLCDIVYSDGEGGIRGYCYTLPLTQIVDLETVNDECELTTDVAICSVDLKLRSDINGDVRSVSVGGKLCLSVGAYCNADVLALSDAYSTTNELEVMTDNVAFSKVVMKINENFACKKVLDFAEGLIDRVVDCWCDTRIISCTADNGKITIKGMVCVNILACDSSGEHNYYERNIDFDYANSLPQGIVTAACEPHVTVLSLECNRCSGGVEVKVQMNIRADVINTVRENLIVSADLTDRTLQKSSAPLVIYFAESGESVWDIAKRYATSVDRLAELNSLSDDVVKKRMLLIPSV